MLVRCEILATGPGPSEAIIGITTADGSRQEVIVAARLVRDGAISVGSPLLKEGGNTLVELPRETVSGRWRIWVPAEATLPDPVLQAAE